jgi:diphthamide synthase (EF-2-diphthine--ammonia ligase)
MTKKMSEAVSHFKNRGVTHFIFGDIFLSDIKAYRENKLHPYGIMVEEPLWGKTSKETIEEFLQSGIKAKIIVTQADKLDETYIGKELNRDFVEALPKDVDLCGENGEYHTLSYAGDLFKKDIAFSIVNTQKVSYDIKLDNGQIRKFEYWQAEVTE